MYPKRIKLFQDIQRMKQTWDQTVDDIAGTSFITSTIRVKSVSQTCCTAKVIVDKRSGEVKTLQIVEADASLL